MLWMVVRMFTTTWRELSSLSLICCFWFWVWAWSPACCVPSVSCWSQGGWAVVKDAGRKVILMRWPTVTRESRLDSSLQRRGRTRGKQGLLFHLTGRTQITRSFVWILIQLTKEVKSYWNFLHNFRNVGAYQEELEMLVIPSSACLYRDNEATVSYLCQ